ncbi:MAG: alpha,alpha-trehalose phosphorylase [Fusobacteriaceae bacterium]|jgi:alpha,alpha-trehalose phosphorylase|nr:hypothetical protein [Fusobacteriales bacterium]MDN5304424.1 alpha,alpha-trehalose phosphorylase [Fusobacteriaceae bacterium]
MLNWCIVKENFDKENFMLNETLFHLANGYLGVRDSFEEDFRGKLKSVRGTYINGFYETEDIQYGEKLYGYAEYSQSILNITDVQTILLNIDGERFSLLEGNIKSFKNELNVKEGYVKREILWESNSGKVLKIDIKRMVSFTRKELFIIEYNVTPLNFNGEIEIISIIDGDVSNITASDDPRIGTANAKHLDVIRCEVKENIGIIENKTRNSNMSVITSCTHDLNKENRLNIDKKEDKIIFKFSLEAKENEKIEFVKYSIFTDSVRYENNYIENLEILKEVVENGKAFYFDAQKVYLNEFWKSSDIIIDGDEKLQEGLRYNLYQLLQSVGKDMYTNIAAKGISGEGYEGHYFWDTDIYILPFFMFTNSFLAKNLLMYRYNTLDRARNRAKMMGHLKGALYPWRTINGDECSAFFPAGTAQYHINTDIAYSFIQYYLITEDKEFMQNYGAEVLFETARVMFDIGHFNREGKFVINDVTGPDEYTCIVNNNYYTNVMTKYLFENTKLAWEILNENKEKLQELISKIGIDEEEIKAFEKAKENMYLPFDEKLKIHPQDDSFLNKKVWDFKNTPKENYPLLLHYHPLTLYRYQVCKQADTVLAHFLREEETTIDIIKNDFEYYEKITTHDSSLSTCIFSIMASRLGLKEKSYDYFINNARLDLDDLHHNTKNGIHTAAMGGSWMGVVFGFVGMRIKNGELHFNPLLPDKINKIKFKINFKHRELEITLDKEGLDIKLISGNSLDVYINNNKKTVE